MRLCGLLLLLGTALVADARAQTRDPATALCELIDEAEMASRLGGKPSRPRMTDWDSNTRVAICNRQFDIGGKIFFVQATFFLAQIGSDPARPEWIGPAHQGNGTVFVNAHKGRRELAVLAGYEPREEVAPQLVKVVSEFTYSYMKRWPIDL
ncbi:MAG: hypothetical protein JOY81_07020 [Alphaproteobacteria bacterium]|nr:hypothetical protein [Alphaproteobacteria bacterium]